jgi:predicted kinase
MKIILLMGIPGSGKSTYTKNLSGVVKVCSADHWFERSGVYTFNPSELGKAHGDCLWQYADVLRSNDDLLSWGYSHGDKRVPEILVVDNTNTTALELAPYVALAQAYNVEYEIRVFNCTPEESFQRNTHDVPLSSCQRMYDRMQQTLKNFPYHWNKPI